jgi:hypothetical protein
MERGKKETLKRVPMRSLVASVKKDIQKIVRESNQRKPKRK